MLSWFLSRKCVLCQHTCSGKHNLCYQCEQNLPWLTTQYYPKLVSYHKVIALFHYTFPISYMITQLKFHQRLIYANVFAHLLANKIKQNYTNRTLPELLIPIPLHDERLKERGFNQGLEIAKSISKQYKIKLDIHSCIRQKHTDAQSSLNIKEREKNIKNAFFLKDKISAKHIAIIDDVITSGHTIIEFSSIFHSSSVEKIDIWCCALTTPDNIF